MRELNYLDIFRELNKRGIEYIVCGGIAVNIHGIPRMTYDIDLLVRMEDENLKRLLGLLKEWNFKPKVSVDIMDFALEEKRLEWIKNKHMKAFNLYNTNWSISEIDILIDSPVDYEVAVEDVVCKKVESVKIPVISVNHLIKMKKGTARKQDEADIRYLRTLK